MSEAAARVAQQRAAKDHYFATDPGSPLSAAQRAAFSGLQYYPYDPSLVVRGTVRQPLDGAPFTVQTSTGEQQTYRRAAVLPFQVAGWDTAVTLLLRVAHGHAGGGFFVPFRDTTSGSETYGAGRYIDLGPEAVGADGTVTIDFNEAYNPYCAYNDRWSCPLPPPDNWLQVPIRAGERTFST